LSITNSVNYTDEITVSEKLRNTSIAMNNQFCAKNN